jgi:hypothetical protein
LIEVGQDQTREFRLLLTRHSKAPPPSSIPLTFEIVDTKSGERASATDHFFSP